MNVAIVMLHLECPSQTRDASAPPKLLLTHNVDHLVGTCPGCGMVVAVAITPVSYPHAVATTS